MVSRLQLDALGSLAAVGLSEALWQAPSSPYVSRVPAASRSQNLAAFLQQTGAMRVRWRRGSAQPPTCFKHMLSGRAGETEMRLAPAR